MTPIEAYDKCLEIINNELDGIIESCMEEREKHNSLNWLQKLRANNDEDKILRLTEMLGAKEICQYLKSKIEQEKMNAESINSSK